MRARLAPIRTRACVATAGPAKPVTHAARRHQHHTVTPTPTPNGGRGRGKGPSSPPLPSSYRPEHRGSSVLRSSPSFLRLSAARTRGYARSNAEVTHTHRATTALRNRDSDLSSRGVRFEDDSDDALGQFDPRSSSRLGFSFLGRKESTILEFGHST